MISLRKIKEGGQYHLAATGAGAGGNLFVKWLNLTDADGGEVARYKLMLNAPAFSFLHNTVYTGMAEFGYLAFITFGAFGKALTEWVMDPSRWLGPAENLYREATAIVYDRVPPSAIAAIAFLILVASVFMFNGPAGSAVQVNSAQWQRLGAGLVIVTAILLITHNPATIIRWPMDLVQSFVGDMSFTKSSGGPAAYVASKDLDMMRAVSFMINYHDTLSAECAKAWSETINAGGGNPPCLTPEQLAATDPDMVTAATAFFLAPCIGISFLFFGAVLALKVFNHLSLAFVYLVGVVYAAALALRQRRQYDAPKRVGFRFLTHLGLCLGFYFIGSLVRAGLTHLVFALLPENCPLFVHAALLGFVTAGAAVIIIALSRNTETIYSLFKDSIEQRNFWNVLNPDGSRSALGDATYDALSKPAQWATDQYRTAREAVTTRWNQLRDGNAPEGHDMHIPDEELIDKAAEQIVLGDQRSVEPVVIDPRTPLTASAPQSGSATSPTTQVLVPNAKDELITGLPADTGQIHEPNTTQAPPVYFIGGLPTMVPPPGVDEYRMAPKTVEPHDTSTTTEPQPELTRLQAMRQEAAQLHRGPDLEEIIAATTATYESHSRPAAATQQNPNRSRPTDHTPRGILDTAQLSYRFDHYRNILRAKGIDAPVALPEDPECWETLAFVTTDSGENTVVSEYGLGFGDKL